MERRSQIAVAGWKINFLGGLMESTIGKKIQVALSKAGARVWRNNVGLAWVGRDIIHIGPDVIIKDARPFRGGLCEGSSDYIGLVQKIVTQDMVGKKIAVFVACEVKTKRGRASIAQTAFIAAVNLAGGIAFIARSESEAIDAIG